MPERAEFPAQANGRFVKLQDLRYGENPHQSAAFYRDLQPAPGSLVTAKQLQGKELSYNNIADADAAWECVKSFDAGDGPRPASSSSTPTRAASRSAASCGEAYAKALEDRPDLGLRRHHRLQRAVDGPCAEAVAKQFVEVLIAPAFSAEALAVFAAKKNARVLQIDLPAVRRRRPQHATTSSASARAS